MPQAVWSLVCTLEEASVLSALRLVEGQGGEQRHDLRRPRPRAEPPQHCLPTDDNNQVQRSVLWTTTLPTKSRRLALDEEGLAAEVVLALHQQKDVVRHVIPVDITVPDPANAQTSKKLSCRCL